jgi:hypothetical protein
MLPASPAINGRRTVSLVGSGSTQQQLVVDSLLPQQVTVSVDNQIPNENGYNETAEYERVKYRLKIDATGGPARTRFLHVLQGLDASASPYTPTLIQSSAGTPFQGAEVGGDSVVMPVDVGPGVATTTFAVSNAVSRFFVTGLAPGQRYEVAIAPSASGKQVVVTASASGAYTADAGGVVQAPPGTTTPPPPPPPPPPSGLALTTALNASSYRAGQTMTVTATLTPGTATTPVDAYIVVQLPSGGYMSWTFGGLVPGLVPIVRNFVPVNYNGVVASLPIPGGTPFGNYAWLSALTSPGTLNLVTAIGTAGFAVVP